jgi:hypothetical protein
MERPAALAACAAVLAGCATTAENITMPAATAESLNGREISLSQRQKPGFTASTAREGMALGVFTAIGGMVGGLIAGAMRGETGNDVVQKHNVPDPAEQIAAELGAALAARYGAKLHPARTPLATPEAAEAVKAARGADLVLDVRTGVWAMNYFVTSPDKYRLHYAARARLIDAKSGRVVAEGGCGAPRYDKAEDAPTYDELVANGAARLKQEMAKAAEYCAAEFASKMFSFDIAQYRADRTAVAAAPKPEPAAPPAVAERAGAISPNKGLPVAGTLWKYRYEDRKFGKRERTFSVQLASTAGTSVIESFSSGGEEQMYASNSQEMNFAMRRIEKEPVYELAPYLLAHLRPDSAPPTERPAYPGVGGSAEWKVRIIDMQREQVAVPAGTFDAIRLRVTGENPSLLHTPNSSHAAQMASNEIRTQRFEYTVWYVPEIGRYVQSRHQTFNRLGNPIGDEWVQLASVERPR